MKRLLCASTFLFLAACTAAGTPPTADSSTSSSEARSSTSGWRDYDNARLGFSMKLPTRVDIGIDGHVSAVTAIDDPENDAVYITTKEYDDDAVARPTTLAVLRGNGVSMPDSWLIKGADVGSDAELATFVSKTFGAGCEIGTRETVAGGYERLRVGKKSSATDGTCSVFGGSNPVMLFSRDKHRLLYWEQGGDVMFADKQRQASYEEAMIESVRFL